MATEYAQEFSQILPTLSENNVLREAVLKLIDEQPVPGKVTEEGNRLNIFKDILKSLVKGEINLLEAFSKTEVEIPRMSSIYSDNNRVFASGWAERLVRIQLSRFYNQAVMEKLISEGETQCFVPHSSEEEASSNCSRQLAGNTQDIQVLYNRLIDSYVRGNWGKDLKIPDHPHCSHVITPFK
ncbi:MAG TPA: hypothetical protein VK400_04050 [Pyrinomonadaceae bacterium]|nr:hypothetical protein [Pyrinomonadaceae bacterium]